MFPAALQCVAVDLTVHGKKALASQCPQTYRDSNSSFLIRWIAFPRVCKQNWTSGSRRDLSGAQSRAHRELRLRDHLEQPGCPRGRGARACPFRRALSPGSGVQTLQCNILSNGTIFTYNQQNQESHGGSPHRQTPFVAHVLRYAPSKAHEKP